MKDTNSITAVSHWLEHLHINLKGMATDSRRTAFALLNSPWLCPKEDVVQYVPEPLNHAIVLMQRSVLRHVFGKRAPLSARTAILDTVLNAYTFQSDGGEIGLQSNALVAYEAYVGMAKEDLGKVGHRWDELSGEAKASLLTLYATCETAVHVMAGMFEKLDVGNGSLRYAIQSQLRPAHKLMWFSRYWAQQSTISDSLMALEVNSALKRTRGTKRRTPVFKAWVDLVLDKYLCLHKNYIPELLRTKNGNALVELRGSAELLCFLWLQLIEHQRGIEETAQAIFEDQPLATISYARLEDSGFDATEVNTLLAESQAQAPGDQFLTHGNGHKELQVHNMLLKFVLQKYLQSFLKRIGSSRGEWFEKNYLLRYLQERLDDSRFLVRTGIENKNAAYDADVVIYDKVAGIFYFCQVKHRVEVLQPFLRDELNEFSRNKTIRHGIEQLQSLRLQIETPEVRSRLITCVGKKLVGTQPLGQRSRFLLIHTVENFDMCTSDGVAMYEWNTFRNLLQGLMLHRTKEISGESRYRTQDLDFADIEGVQAHLMEITGRMFEDMGTGQPTPAHLYALLHRAELSLNYRTALWLNNWPILPTGSASLRTPLL